MIIINNDYYCLLLRSFDFTKFAIFGDPVLRQLELRSVHVTYTVLLVNVLTVRIFEYNCKTRVWTVVCS